MVYKKSKKFSAYVDLKYSCNLRNRFFLWVANTRALEDVVTVCDIMGFSSRGGFLFVKKLDAYRCEWTKRHKLQP